MHTHHDESYGSEPAAAASWFMAMALTMVVAVALIVALFVWAPWDDNNTGPAGNNGGNAPAEQQDGSDSNADGGDINIDPNVDINTGE